MANMKQTYGQSAVPNFIGIGAARAGTTWLYSVLQQHPQVWLPPIKELHYFDRKDYYPSPNTLLHSQPVRRLFGFDSASKKFRRSALGNTWRTLKSGNSEHLAWMFRYSFGQIDDRWYVRLFKGRPETVVGELTPAYAMLSSHDIAQMAALLSDVKLIFIMRDPVERTWSQAKHSGFLAANPIESLSPQTLIQWACSDTVAQRNDYLMTINRFRQYFSSQRLFICFYDEIASNPMRLHGRINNFLEVSDISLAGKKYSKRVNQKGAITMPAWVRENLSRLLLPQMRELSEHVGRYADEWVAKAEQAISD